MCFVDHLAHASWVVVRADHQLVAFEGHEVVVESADDGASVFGQVHEVVTASGEQHMAVGEDGIAVGIFLRHVVDFWPAADVGPSEVATAHVDIVAFLKHHEVDGGVEARRIVFLYLLQLLLGREALPVGVEPVAHENAVCLEEVEERGGAPEHEARVPEKLTALDKHAGIFERWFFGEGFDARGGVVDALAPLLDIAVGRVGNRWHGAHDEEVVVLRHEVESSGNLLGEVGLVNDELIGGRDDDVGVAVDVGDVAGGPCCGGGR